MERKKIAQLFEENKEQLYKELQELYQPIDVQKLQNIIILFFDGQLSPKGEYGQRLTQAEMYLLNSCVKIWQTQIKLQNSLSTYSVPVLPTLQKTTKTKHFSKVESKNAIIGTLIGSGIGAFFNPIVTIAGALTGLCLTIYLTDKLFNEEINQNNNIESTLPPERKIIDADSIIHIVKEMCENIDNIILTFNVQVKNLMPDIVEGFENQYPDILEAFQKFAGGMSEYKNDETYANIYNRYSSIEDALAQHGILIEHYNVAETEKQLYFEVQENEKITNVKEVLPALIKKGIVIKKGKILVSKK